MKSAFTLLAIALCISAVTSCQRGVPPVPSSGRAVVGPSGSVQGEKPWNGPTKSEGDAILGPLSNARR